jgi:predicted Fe-Mo cluster-binding NifX family protein
VPFVRETEAHIFTRNRVDQGGFPDKLKIAIPLFKERVSPHFGSSRRLLLMDTDGTTISQETLLNIEEEGPVNLLRRLVDLGGDEVVCGGIHRYYKDWLIRKGVTVMDNQRGIAKEIIQNLLRSKG